MSGLTLHQILAAARGRRRDLGWSQAELARRAGLSRTWVNDFEQGTGGASIEAVLRVLDILGLPLDFVRDDQRDDGQPTVGWPDDGQPAEAQAAEGKAVIDLDALIDRYRQ